MAKTLTLSRKKPSPQISHSKESVQRKITGREKKPTLCIVCKITQKAFMITELLCTGIRSSTRVPCWHMGPCDTMEYANGSFSFCSLVDCSF